MNEAASRRTARDVGQRGISQARVVGEVVYVSGQVSTAAALSAQVEEAWAGVVALVEAAGGSARDVVELTVFVCGPSPDPDRSVLSAAWRVLQPLVDASVGEPAPAVTVVQVVALARPAMQIEIKAVAHLGSGGSSGMSSTAAAHEDAPRVRRIYRYPVKSMLGELLEEAAVDEKGLAGDRAFAVVDAEQETVASAKLPRRWSRLLDFRATYVEPPALGEPPPPILITLPDGSTWRSDDDGIDAALSAALGSPVRLVSGVHDHTMPYQATDAEGSVIDTEKAGTIGRLGPADRFFDLSALHLLTTSTLEHLRELEPAADFDERRFRPNLVLDPGTPGFVENDWVGKVLDLERLRILVVRRTGPMRDADAGATRPGPRSPHAEGDRTVQQGGEPSDRRGRRRARACTRRSKDVACCESATPSPCMIRDPAATPAVPRALHAARRLSRSFDPSTVSVLTMIAHLIKITARPGKLDELVEFLRWDADVALAEEPGTLRFDVYAVPDEPDAIFLYEMYASDVAFAAHRDGEPYKRFVDHIVPNVVDKMDFLFRSASPVVVNVAG